MTQTIPPRRAHGRLDLPLVALVPGGTFTMGHPNIVEAEAPNPPHELVISPFAIGVHPVTNAEYGAFLQATAAPPPATFGHPLFGAKDRPVVGIAWEEARR